MSNTRPGTPALTAYGPPSSCFSYYEPGARGPTVFRARTPAACTQALADKRKVLASTGGSASVQTVGCARAIYCVNLPKGSISDITCFASADAWEK